MVGLFAQSRLYQTHLFLNPFLTANKSQHSVLHLQKQQQNHQLNPHKLIISSLATIKPISISSSPDMVKSIRVHELGGAEVLKWEDVELGDPKDGEIRVRNKAIGVNFIDVYFRTGVYKAAAIPFTPGMEAVGVVTAVGPGLTGRQVGDLVAYAGFPMGAYAEEQILPADKVVPVPTNIDPSVAAAVLLKGMTAQFLLRRCFKVERGHTILVHAAAGGVGSLLCQWANALGAVVIGTVSTKEKAAQAKEDGCHHVIVSKEENFVERVTEITAGHGVEVVYDSVGKDTFEGSLACLKIRGHLVCFGQSSGAPDPIPLSALAAKSLFLTRPSLMQYTAKRDELLEAAGEEINTFKRKEVCSVVDSAQGQAPPLARQPLHDTDDEVPHEELELGSVYELYHKNLPPGTPVQLRSTRVVMVSEKTDLNVAIRYPSILSLRTYFSKGITEMYPALDEKFLMELKLARKVLLRQVASQEFAAQKHLEKFWLVKSKSQSDSNMKNGDIGLARVLMNNNMLRWGARKEVTIIGKHKETIRKPRRTITPYTFDLPMDDTFIGQYKETSETPSTFGLHIGNTFNGKGDTFTGKHKEICDTLYTVGLVTGDTSRKHKETSDTPSTLGLIIYDQEVKNQQENVGDEIEEEEEEVDHETDKEGNDDEAKEVKEEEEVEDEKEDLEKEQKSTRILRKRKKANQVKHVWRQVNKKPMKKCKKLVIRNPTDRWSKERYMAAELSLLEAMQEKKAMIGNSITRAALRVEARKRIGDTGLLDHLLKHVANKVAPGGNLRFRRSHNADGAMEYWLEDADLLKIRKDAGVTDPLWIPPPGWKPGDSPTQHPIMAKELNHLKEEISFIKREYLPKKQVEEEMAGLRREILELTSKNKQEQSQRIVVSEVVDTSPLQVMDICNFLLHSESETSDVNNSALKKGQYKKQSVVISEILKKIQAWIQASEVDEKTTQMEAVRSPKAGTSLITTTASSDAQEKPKVADENEGIAPPKQPAGVDQEKSEESGHLSPPATQTQAPAPPEGKAAKIERLKSGFRLCRPQGTFLWPNMVNPTNTTSSASNMSSSQVTLQVEGLLQVVPTPPSVNSSAPPLPPYHHHHLPSSPVKPVPERRPVAVSSLSEGLPLPTTTTTLLNLNDSPTNPSSQQIIKLQPLGANFSAENKKRKSPSSTASGSSDTPSCLSNAGTPAWLADSGRHPQWF